MQKLSNEELATVLAALRYFQRTYTGGPEDDIATDGGTLERLGDCEIDALCERINASDPEQPAGIYDADKGSVTCPHCKFVGILGGAMQPGKYGQSFRYVEDMSSARDIEALDAEGTLHVSANYEHHPEGAANERLECRNCLGEFSIPAGLQLIFE